MKRNIPGGGYKPLIKELLRDTGSTSFELIRITVPAVIITKIFEELGLIDYISLALEPVMGLMGVPGELGLVWATGLLTSLYGAVAVFAALAPGLDLTVAQVTALSSAMLIAHSLPVELSISKRAGAGILPTAFIRLSGALLYGMLIYHLCRLTGWWQGPAPTFFRSGGGEKTLLEWAGAQVLNLGIIIVVIFFILIAMRVLRKIGFLRLLERLLSPVLPFFGMSRRAAPVTVVGMIMGIGYGGALIIRETTQGDMDRRDIFNSLALMAISHGRVEETLLMALSHGLVEDTLLMVALGAALGGILWGRLLFSLVFIYCMVKIVDYYRKRQRVGSSIG